VGGENFGLGSAHEQACNALKGAGIAAVVAKSIDTELRIDIFPPFKREFLSI
jgi:3-isopropylmalate dehydratase small subunit